RRASRRARRYRAWPWRRRRHRRRGRRSRPSRRPSARTAPTAQRRCRARAGAVRRVRARRRRTAVWTPSARPTSRTEGPTAPAPVWHPPFGRPPACHTTRRTARRWPAPCRTRHRTCSRSVLFRDPPPRVPPLPYRLLEERAVLLAARVRELVVVADRLFVCAAGQFLPGERGVAQVVVPRDARHRVLLGGHDLVVPIPEHAELSTQCLVQRPARRELDPGAVRVLQPRH